MRYTVQGQRCTGAEWVTIGETNDPVEAVHGAHYVESWFWVRVLEDGVMCVGPF